MTPFFVLIKAQLGRAYDVAEGDHAFTDWDALEADVMRFLEETEAA